MTLRSKKDTAKTIPLQTFDYMEISDAVTPVARASIGRKFSYFPNDIFKNAKIYSNSKNKGIFMYRTGIGVN